MDIMIHYGCLADKLEKQVNQYGFTLGKAEERLQKLNDAMLMCWVHGLVTDSQKDSMMKKMQKQIIKAMKPMEERKLQ